MNAEVPRARRLPVWVGPALFLLTAAVVVLLGLLAFSILERRWETLRPAIAVTPIAEWEPDNAVWGRPPSVPARRGEPPAVLIRRLLDLRGRGRYRYRGRILFVLAIPIPIPTPTSRGATAEGELPVTRPNRLTAERCRTNMGGGIGKFRPYRRARRGKAPAG